LSQKLNYVTYSTKSTTLSNTPSFNTTQFKKRISNKEARHLSKTDTWHRTQIIPATCQGPHSTVCYKYNKQTQEKEMSRSKSITALIHTEPTWQTVVFAGWGHTNITFNITAWCRLHVRK